MILKLGIMKNCGSALLGICLLASVACADVCFTHTYTVDEFLLGTKQAELIISYADASMAVDKHTRFTGTWMKRFSEKRNKSGFPRSSCWMKAESTKLTGKTDVFICMISGNWISCNGSGKTPRTINRLRII